MPKIFHLLGKETAFGDLKLHSQIPDSVQNLPHVLEMILHVGGKDHQIIDICLAMVGIWVGDTSLREALEPKNTRHLKIYKHDSF